MPYAVAQHLEPSSPLPNLLILLGSLLWVLTYALVIHKGWKERTAGFPWPATCFNLAWEIYFGLVSDVPKGLSLVLVRVWLVLDLVLFYLELRFGKEQQPNEIRKRFYYPSVAVILLTAILTEFTFIPFYEDFQGTELAFIINLLMAVLFISLLFNQPDLKGLSYPAAWTMTLGTGANSVAMILLGPRAFPGHPIAFMYVLFGAIFVFNCIYIAGFTAVSPSRRWASR